MSDKGRYLVLSVIALTAALTVICWIGYQLLVNQPNAGDKVCSQPVLVDGRYVEICWYIKE